MNLKIKFGSLEKSKKSALLEYSERAVGTAKNSRVLSAQNRSKLLENMGI